LQNKDFPTLGRREMPPSFRNPGRLQAGKRLLHSAAFGRAAVYGGLKFSF
jgi:hypothetical protein